MYTNAKCWPLMPSVMAARNGVSYGNVHKRDKCYWKQFYQSVLLYRICFLWKEKFNKNYVYQTQLCSHINLLSLYIVLWVIKRLRKKISFWKGDSRWSGSVAILFQKQAMLSRLISKCKFSFYFYPMFISISKLFHHFSRFYFLFS